MNSGELPIKFWAGIKNVIKDYYLGKWCFGKEHGLRHWFYKKMVYAMWKMA